MILETIARNCFVCGSRLTIRINEDKTYEGGHYFGKMRLPIGKGKYKKVGTFKLAEDGESSDVVKWTGKRKKVEYWECEKCFAEEED